MARQPQTFANHAHRPTLSILAFLCLDVAAVAFLLRWRLIGGRVSMAVGLAGLMGAIFLLIGISRVYTTNLQDRIIRLELRLRAMRLLTADQQQQLETLSLKQMAALRFASDAEFAPLCERAARERLSPTNIKRAIKTWVPDYHRT